MLNKKIFSLGIKGLSTIWPELANVLDDPVASKLWYRVLADLTDNQFEEAIKHIATISKFKPKPSDIREAALSEDNKEIAEEAWVDVINALRSSAGYFGTPEFDNWITNECVKVLGWDSLKLMTYNQEPIIRAQFLKTYNNLQKREKKAELTGKPELSPKVKKLLLRAKGEK